MAKQSAGIDVNSLLAQAAATAKPTKSKTKTPTITVDGIDKDLARFLKAKQDKANAEAEMATAEAEILPKALAARVKELRALGRFESAVVVNEAVLLVTQNKYSKVPLDAGDALEKAFGDDMDKLIKKVTEISLSEKAINDPEGLRRIIEAIGVDKFKDYLVVEQYFQPTEALHHGIVMDPKIEAKAKPLLEQKILKPTKPSLRVK
jgi:hypothetical protein